MREYAIVALLVLISSTMGHCQSPSKLRNTIKLTPISNQGTAPLTPGADTILCNKELYSKAAVENGRLVVRGPPVPYSGGNFSAYIVLNNDDGCSGPAAIGFDMIGIDLATLPTGDTVKNPSPDRCKSDPYGDGCLPPNDDFNVLFPGTNTSFSPFTFLGVNWQPLGHPPLSMYASPHFDMHFWLKPEAVKSEIKLGTYPNVCGEGLDPQVFYSANMPIPKECFSDSLANMRVVAPGMGVHYVDVNSPVVASVLQGTPDPTAWVDPVFMVGGYKGQVVFLEPMVELSYMQDLSSAAEKKCYQPPLPAAYPNPGFYPTNYCIDASTANVVRFEMDTFTHQATPGCKSTDYAPKSYYNAYPPASDANPLPDFCKVPMDPNAAANATTTTNTQPVDGTDPSATQQPSSTVVSTAGSTDLPVTTSSDDADPGAAATTAATTTTTGPIVANPALTTPVPAGTIVYAPCILTQNPQSFASTSSRFLSFGIILLVSSIFSLLI